MLLNSNSIPGESSVCVSSLHAQWSLMAAEFLAQVQGRRSSSHPSVGLKEFLWPPLWLAVGRHENGGEGHMLSTSLCRGFTADWCLGLPGHPRVCVSLCIALLWASGAFLLFPCCVGDRNWGQRGSTRAGWPHSVILHCDITCSAS